MFNLMDYKQGEEIKERLDRLEKKIELLIEIAVSTLPVAKKSCEDKPTPKKKGK